MFIKVSQSKTTEGSLFGEPFTLTITTVDKSKLPTNRKTFGTGHNARSCVPKKSLIEIKNQEQKYCLFFAIEVC
jgi:hypothetical protein